MNDEQKLRSAQDHIFAMVVHFENLLEINDLKALKRNLEFALEATQIEAQVQEGTYVQEFYLDAGARVYALA